MKSELFEQVNKNADQVKKSQISQEYKDMGKEFVLCMIMGVLIGTGVGFFTMFMLSVLGVI